MPLYEYEHEGEAGEGCRPRFELFQPMAAEALTHCPACKRPCRRVISTFSVAASGMKGALSRSNLEAHGFSQFTRKGKGYYEKTAGQGPPGISDGS